MIVKQYVKRIMMRYIVIMVVNVLVIYLCMLIVNLEFYLCLCDGVFIVLIVWVRVFL
jgi:hypothetical protein